ncbi:hypothetical protein DICVIV_11787 [Dictyocaulus viviparus]|uniref:Uncharacterized protein n=1 Tax=Dictyocaulus viviparus TaxID=29172 RepID=A0A0D8XCA2_DICVI|nr:hypothetical protein DICVIV_11787 [Dictyocaulus viviparus]
MTVAKERPPTIIAQSQEELCHNIRNYLVETLAHLIKYNGLISIGVSGTMSCCSYSGGSMSKIFCEVLRSIDNLEWKRIRIFMNIIILYIVLDEQISRERNCGCHYSFPTFASNTSAHLAGGRPGERLYSLGYHSTVLFVFSSHYKPIYVSLLTRIPLGLADEIIF